MAWVACACAQAATGAMPARGVAQVVLESGTSSETDDEHGSWTGAVEACMEPANTGAEQTLRSKSSAEAEVPVYCIGGLVSLRSADRELDWTTFPESMSPSIHGVEP